jgi:predicted nuclease with TOPRIM domain
VALRAQIEPHVARLKQLHEQLEPVHDQMADLHVSLEPMLVEIESIHAEMELDHERMEQLHAELEPIHEEVERLHEAMEPIREELERTGERLGAAVTREVESAIRDRLGPAVGEDAPWNEAAERIGDTSHIRIQDGVLRVEAPRGETRTILQDLLSPHRRVDQDVFEVALEETVEALHPLTRSVSPE